jgi:RNA polymerase sigma factor FliA
VSGQEPTEQQQPVADDSVPRVHEERLIRDGLPLLRAEAQRLWRRFGGQVEIDELHGLGHVALIELARAYDAARGPFPPYATLRLRWAILDGVRRHSHGRVAAARARALGASERTIEADAAGALPEPEEGDEPSEQLRALLGRHAGALAVALVAACGDMAGAADPQEDPEQAAIRATQAAALRAAVIRLPVEQRALVERHYFEDEQFDKIAADLGISRSWASRLHAQAMDTLAEALKGPDDLAGPAA